MNAAPGVQFVRTLRTLTAILAVSATLLVPIDAPVVPDSLGRIAGTAPAAAQTYPDVVLGNPGACPPDTVVVVGSPHLCELIGSFGGNFDACPFTPFDSSKRMSLDPEFGDVCVEHIVDDDTLGITADGTCQIDPAIPQFVGCTANSGYYSMCPGPVDLALRPNNGQYDDELNGMSVELRSSGDSLDVWDTTGVMDHILTVGVCRIRATRRCTSGWRVSQDSCRLRIRRTWTCSGTDLPLNGFNRCYRPSTPTPLRGAPGPCDDGAPAFPLGVCSDYVGNDFLRDPSLVGCSLFAYSIGTSPSYAMAPNPQPSGNPNRNWCSYDANLLDVDCHEMGTTCATLPALCLKRASQTGGCETVIHTVECRERQADHRELVQLPATPAQISASIEVLLREGCEPCVILPFSPVSTDLCPSDATDKAQELADHGPCFRFLLDTATDKRQQCGSLVPGPGVTATPSMVQQLCGAHILATSPPRNHGFVVWRSLHHTGLAMAGSQVVFDVQDVPFRLEADNHRAALYPDAPPRNLNLTRQQLDDYYAEHIYQEFGSYAVPQYAHASIDDLAAGLNYDQSEPGRCRVDFLPKFRVAARLLWPDSPADEQFIMANWGMHAAEWWTNASMEQQAALMRQQGIAERWDLNDLDQQAKRNEALTEHEDCHAEPGMRVWCRWAPARSGYYRVVVQGAWQTGVASINIPEFEMPTTGIAPGGGIFGLYTETQPEGIAVHQARVVTRAP